MSDDDGKHDDIAKLAAELFGLHLAGDDAAHDKLFDSLTDDQRQKIGDRIRELGEKMRRLEEALESDDQTAMAVIEEVAAELALFASGGKPKPEPH